MERIDYAIGAMGHLLIHERPGPSEAGQASFAQRLERLLDFLAPGFAAPSLHPGAVKRAGIRGNGAPS